MVRRSLFILLVSLPTALAAQTRTALPVDSARAAASGPTPGAAGHTLPALSPEDYGKWEVLGAARLSDDGRWLAYRLMRVSRELELHLRRLDEDSTRILPNASGAVFSSDSRWLAYSIRLPEEERKRLTDAGKPVRDSVGLIELGTGKVTAVEGIASFAFSDDGSFLALRRYPGKDGAAAADLIVRELATGIDTRFGNVSEFAWQDESHLLALIIQAEDSLGNGVQLYDPGSGRLRTLIAEPARFSGLTWRIESDDLAVFRTVADTLYRDTAQAVVAWRGLARAKPKTYRLDAGHPEFPEGLRIVDFERLSWAEDGSKLFLSLKERGPRVQPEAEEATPADSAGEARGEGAAATAVSDSARTKAEEAEAARVLVWHPRDIDIIPAQKLSASADSRKSWRSVWHLEADHLVRLADEEMQDIMVVEGRPVVLGRDVRPYEEERRFGPLYYDVFLVDLETGARRRIIDRVLYFFGPSPGGRYVLYLEDDEYWVYDIEKDQRVNLTGSVPTSFVIDDPGYTFDEKPPYGIAGWTEGDRELLAYDEFDIWRIRLDGARAERLTNGVADSVSHRRLRLTMEKADKPEAIDPAEPLYLFLNAEWSRDQGFGRMRLGGPVERLVWEPRGVWSLEKAKDADVYVYRAESFEESPNYYVAGPDLRDARRVTRTNPFQADYAWGRSELVDYTNKRGERLQGALFYPANHDPTRKYPMVVYIYEKLSRAVNVYDIPTDEFPYSTSIFTAEGYFVFYPDINYRKGDPGLSALEAVVPAVERVVESGMVDRGRIALMGHSWGAYQTVFIATQTDLFRTAIAGAPLTNLVSMYGSVYWDRGITNALLFEIGQGRMGFPPWEDWERYATNSPLHQLPKLEIPLLMAFGDKDGAVEFNQGVEFYNSARRAGKHVVMLVYEDENHGINSRKESRIDFHRRVKAWLGHYLKDEPAPKWISEGVPYLEQMREREAKRGASRRRERT